MCNIIKRIFNKKGDIMTTTQINYESIVNVNQIRTDVLVELAHSLHRKLWENYGNLDIIENEIERRENEASKSR